MFCNIVAGCSAKFALTNGTYNHAKKLSSLRDAVKLKGGGRNSWPEDLTWIVTTATDKKGSDSIKLPPSPTGDVLAFLQYTSGSTSTPKGVMISHSNLQHNLTIITNELQAKEDTVVVSWLPQYHDMGLIGSLLGCIYCGGSGFYLSPLSFLQRPMLWMESVSKYGATHLQAPNFAFKLTARKYNNAKLNLQSVRHIINAAEPVDEESMESFYKVFAPHGLKRVIFPTYGLAEHTVFVCSGGQQILKINKQELEVNGQVALSDDAADCSTLVGCGYPQSQKVDVRIVNAEDGVVLPEGKIGEIWVNSASKAQGYFEKPAETKEDFFAQLKDDVSGVGYLRTGDLGFMHKNELFICGRLKDLIIVGGRNYYPQDIEATAESTSDLLRPGCSAAFTIDSTVSGDEEVALVMELKQVPAANVAGTCDPLVNQIKAAINQEHSLSVAEIVLLQTRTVPKTSSGKIARAWCRKAFKANTLKVVYRKSFRTSTPAKLEVDASQATTAVNQNGNATKKLTPSEVRAMGKAALVSMLKRDVSRVTNVPESDINTRVALITMMDSLTISQFKGLFEANYASQISDEYLFRESTTIDKLAEVARLGFAPDDGEGGGGDVLTGPGQATGLAGALGCPPGVVCTIL